MPQANQQIPNGFGAFRTIESEESVSKTKKNDTEQKYNIPSKTDIIYASFTDAKPTQNITAFTTRARKECNPDSILCEGTDKCIEKVSYKLTVGFMFNFFLF